jgi:hypothetical protein
VAEEEAVITIRFVAPPDDDFDAAHEAVANGLRALVLEEVPDEDPFTLRLRLSPEVSRG